MRVGAVTAALIVAALEVPALVEDDLNQRTAGSVQVNHNSSHNANRPVFVDAMFKCFIPQKYLV